MTKLKRLGFSVVLTCVLTVTAFAGETSTPPSTACNPGELQAPPCAAAQLTSSDAANPGEMQSPLAASGAIEAAVTEAAIGLVRSALSLF